jgi:hypothetical protein
MAKGSPLKKATIEKEKMLTLCSNLEVEGGCDEVDE